jgi:hypothetical protein
LASDFGRQVEPDVNFWLKCFLIDPESGEALFGVSLRAFD